MNVIQKFSCQSSPPDSRGRAALAYPSKRYGLTWESTWIVFFLGGGKGGCSITPVRASERETTIQKQAPTPMFGELLKTADSFQNLSALISCFRVENSVFPSPLIAKVLY